ncbi:MAG: hypothetical protein FJ387_18525 [Verrucomicrobia bacterium]|nr:hypothetical protein [Verrucomicrobiota bacterium]
MKTMSNDEFAKRMMLLAKPASEFKPSAYYDADGDCIEFLAKPDPFYEERVDDLVTVYYSQKTGEVIGSLLKGVSKLARRLAQKLPGFLITIQDGRIRLEHLFLAGMWLQKSEPQAIDLLAYKKLAEIAERTSVDVSAELCAAA